MLNIRDVHIGDYIGMKDWGITGHVVNITHEHVQVSFIKIPHDKIKSCLIRPNNGSFKFPYHETSHARFISQEMFDAVSSMISRLNLKS